MYCVSRLLHLWQYIAKYVHGSKLSKSFVTLLSVNCPLFASEVIF